MPQESEEHDAVRIAAEIHQQIQILANPSTPVVRAIRKMYSERFRDSSAAFMLDLGWELLSEHGERWVAYELIAKKGEDDPKLPMLGKVIELGKKLGLTLDPNLKGLKTPASTAAR